MNRMFGVLLGGLVLFGSIGAAHANPCKSNWGKLTSALKAHGPQIARLLCNWSAGDDEAKRDNCQANYEKAVQQAESLSKEWNQNSDTSGAKIGVRGAGFDHWHTGKLFAERTWITPVVTHKGFTLEFERTGGTSDAEMDIDVCLMRPNGNVVEHKARVIKGKNGKRTVKFADAYGHVVQIYLHKKAGLKGAPYRMRAKQADRPPFMRLGRTPAPRRR